MRCANSTDTGVRFAFLERVGHLQQPSENSKLRRCQSHETHNKSNFLDCAFDMESARLVGDFNEASHPVPEKLKNQYVGMLD